MYDTVTSAVSWMKSELSNYRSPMTARKEGSDPMLVRRRCHKEITYYV